MTLVFFKILSELTFFFFSPQSLHPKAKTTLANYWSHPNITPRTQHFVAILESLRGKTLYPKPHGKCSIQNPFSVVPVVIMPLEGRSRGLLLGWATSLEVYRPRGRPIYLSYSIAQSLPLKRTLGKEWSCTPLSRRPSTRSFGLKKPLVVPFFQANDLLTPSPKGDESLVKVVSTISGCWKDELMDRGSE